MKRFTTLFPALLPLHLHKDVGMIPQWMQKSGWQSMLVGVKSDSNDFKGTKIPIALLEPKGYRGHLEKTVLSFLQSKSTEVDVLNVYHLRRDTMFYGLWYKKHNPAGFLYLKMDSYNSEIEKGYRHSKNLLKNFYFKRYEKRFLSACNLISIENQRGVDLFKKKYPRHAEKVVLLHNGVEYSKKIGSQKKDIILSVGRMDDPVKNYKVLLQLIPQLNLENYQIVLVGPGYELLQSEFYSEHPELRSVVEFRGEILKKEVLYTLYTQARLYWQPSVHESFGLAMAEAICHGCYVIGTDGMSAFDDITNDSSFGVKLPNLDPNSWKNTIQSLISRKTADLPDPRSIATFGRERFSWKKITTQLHETIDSRKEI